MHGNSRAQKVILGHRVCKVRNNRVRKEKGLEGGHTEHKASEAQKHVQPEAREAESMYGTRHGAREHVGHEARRACNLTES